MKNLKSALLVLLLISVSSIAKANWTEVTQTDTATFFIDWNSIRKEGNMRTYWWMLNYKKNEDGVYSARVRSTIDCKKETYLDLDFTTFPLPNLEGKPGRGAPPGTWSHIPPGTVIQTLSLVACSK